MSSCTHTDMRKVCASSLLRNAVVTGRPGKTVEVDKSCFYRRKFEVGRVHPQQWVFGGIFMLYQTEPLKSCLTQAGYKGWHNRYF